MALLDLVQNDGNSDEVTTASRRARPKAGDDTTAFPLIRCTKEDEIKRRNLGHGEESMECGRDRVGEDSSATTSVVFVTAGGEIEGEESSKSSLPRFSRHMNGG